MSGQAILVVGMRGTGKTTTVKKLMAKTHPGSRLILDVNGEYKDLFPRDPIDFDTFTNLAKSVKNAVILIEESTIFLDSRGSNQDIRDLLVRARHRNNTVIFVFHTFRSIPKYIYDLCNAVIIHKTSDTADHILERFGDENLVKVFNEIKTANMLTNSEGKQYSPNKYYKIY